MGQEYRLAPSLRLSEIQSKDKDDLVLIHPALLIGFQELRYAIDKPLKVMSGYRSPAHNAKIGGSSSSMHMMGMALDLCPIVADKQIDEVLAEMHIIAKDLGFGGIKWYQDQRFLHIDVGQRRTW